MARPKICKKSQEFEEGNSEKKLSWKLPEKDPNEIPDLDELDEQEEKREAAELAKSYLVENPYYNHTHLMK